MDTIITCYTLFDITNTNVLNRSKPAGDHHQLWNVQRNQQANFDTILQCISLRGNPEIIKYPHRLETGAENIFGFLLEKSKFHYWKFDFKVQNNSVFDDDLDPLGYLIKDCHEIPMIRCGTESIDLPNFLDTTPELNNIYFTEEA